LPEDNVLNGIGDALYDRILRAHAEKARFRVFVIMPLAPAFEGVLHA
jgi:phospholipase D1/2